MVRKSQVGATPCGLCRIGISCCDKLSIKCRVGVGFLLEVRIFPISIVLAVWH